MQLRECVEIGRSDLGGAEGGDPTRHGSFANQARGSAQHSLRDLLDILHRRLNTNSAQRVVILIEDLEAFFFVVVWFLNANRCFGFSEKLSVLVLVETAAALGVLECDVHGAGSFARKHHQLRERVESPPGPFGVRLSFDVLHRGRQAERDVKARGVADFSDSDRNLREAAVRDRNRVVEMDRCWSNADARIGGGGGCRARMMEIVVVAVGAEAEKG